MRFTTLTSLAGADVLLAAFGADAALTAADCLAKKRQACRAPQARVDGITYERGPEPRE